MNKQHDTIESLLQTGKETGLSASEQETMWHTLRDYAEFHPVKETKAPSPLFVSATKWLAVAASVFVISVGTGAASTESFPGEPLYPIKVKVVEPLIGLSKVDETEKLNYQASLLERRLFEMQHLLEVEELTEANMAELETQVEEHGSEIAEVLTKDTDESISNETKLDVLADAVTTLRTHEFIEDTKVSAKRVSKFESTKVSVSKLYQSEASEFAKEKPADAAEYIEEVLEEITSEIATETASTSAAVPEVQDYLIDVEEALDTGTLDKALQYTGEAHQIIELNKRIEELEDDTEE